MDLQPMEPGGQWLAMGGTGEPHYVVNPDHVKRLLAEGYQIVSDPRLPADDEADEEDPDEEDEDEEEEEPEPVKPKKKKVKE